MMQTHTHRTAIAYTGRSIWFFTLTQIVLMNFIIDSYHGSKYGQRSGYNCIGAIDPQISLISGTKYLELTRYKKVAQCGMNHYSQITVYSY